MRGPCACPGGNRIRPGLVKQTDRTPTRTGTRPPPLPSSTPCPYRTVAKGARYYSIPLSKIIRGRFIGPCWMFRYPDLLVNLHVNASHRLEQEGVI